MQNISNNIQLPKKNINRCFTENKNLHYNNYNAFNVQPGLSVFNPDNISSTPPNHFLSDLEKRMSIYYLPGK